MTTLNEPVARPGLLARVKGILLQPKREWELIDGEPATIGGLYTTYVAPLAAIPAICGLVGMLVFGIGAFGINYKPPIGGAVASPMTMKITMAAITTTAV